MHVPTSTKNTFIDQLDLWLQILSITMFLLAYWVYRYSKGDIQSIRPLGYGLTSLGIYILASGLWAAFTWPLIGPYNIIFSDSWPLLGVVLISLGLATIYGAFSRALFYLYAGPPYLSTGRPYCTSDLPKSPKSPRYYS